MGHTFQIKDKTLTEALKHIALHKGTFPFLSLLTHDHDVHPVFTSIVNPRKSAQNSMMKYVWWLFYICQTRNSMKYFFFLTQAPQFDVCENRFRFFLFTKSGLYYSCLKKICSVACLMLLTGVQASFVSNSEFISLKKV